MGFGIWLIWIWDFLEKMHKVSSDSSTPYIFIHTAAQLDSVVHSMETAQVIALDTEADSLHHYYSKVCLIQMSWQEHTVIIDPLTGLDLSDFMGALLRKPIILHGADYDLRMLRTSFGFRPEGEIFDTMLAAQLLGYEQFSLVALVQRFAGLTLTKKGQKSDWSRRPLTEEQLQYAGDDTRYLRLIADKLRQELLRLGRMEWFHETCADMVASTAHDRPLRDPEEAWHIKGWSTLKRRELTFLRQIWKWREKEAQKADLPPFKIMDNPLLLKLAAWSAANPHAPLEEGPKLPQHCTGHRRKALATAIRMAAEMKEYQWPKVRKRRSSENDWTKVRMNIEGLQAQCSDLARQLQITPSVLAPRAALESLLRHRPRTVEEIMACCSLTKWQAEMLAPRILPLLAEMGTKDPEHEGGRLL